jgi:hypothetical protein
MMLSGPGPDSLKKITPIITTKTNYDSNSMDDCELIEDNFSVEEIKETPSQSAVPSSLRLHPNKILIPQRQNQDQLQIKCEIISFHSYLRFSMIVAKQLFLRQAVEQPTKPTEITASDLLPFKAARSGVCGNGFDLLNMLNIPKRNSAMPSISEHIVISVWRMD